MPLSAADARRVVASDDYYVRMERALYKRHHLVGLSADDPRQPGLAMLALGPVTVIRAKAAHPSLRGTA
jgi:hypothetical protein